MSRVYLDHNATAPLRPEARDAMIAAMEVAGNPSSVHAEGRDAKALLERARSDLSEALGCKPAEIVFTGGATEAASVLAGLPAGHDVFVQDTAHDALRVHMRLANWQKRPLGPGHTLAMGLANSETGVISEPPEKIDGQYPFGSGARADWLLLDITQAVGRMPFSFSWSEADLAVLSGHKHGGPKGVGALIVRDGLDINPLSTGGGQELGRRSGTENLIGIAGFAAAAKAAQRDLTDGTMEQVAKLRDILELALEDGSPGTIFVGREGPRLPNTSCFISPGWKGETQVMQMDLAGFAVSAGSACSSGKVKSSSVLRAMGYSEADAGAALRVSLGSQTTEDDVLRFSEAWLKAIHRHQARAA